MSFNLVTDNYKLLSLIFYFFNWIIAAFRLFDTFFIPIHKLFHF